MGCVVERAPSQEWDQQEPGCFQRGWQHEASRVERHHQEVKFPRVPESGRVLVRSQTGGLVACPTCRITNLDSLQLFLSRAFLPVWPLIRCSWPSPRSVSSWGICQEGIFGGECRGSVGRQVDELPPTFWCAISMFQFAAHW